MSQSNVLVKNMCVINRNTYTLYKDGWLACNNDIMPSYRLVDMNELYAITTMLVSDMQEFRLTGDDEPLMQTILHHFTQDCEVMSEITEYLKQTPKN